MRIRFTEIKNELIRGNNPEPYLWPFYFKVDAETIGRALIDAAEFKRAYDDGIPAAAAKSHWAYPFHDLTRRGGDSTDTELGLFEVTGYLHWDKSAQGNNQKWYKAPNGERGNLGAELPKGVTNPVPSAVGSAEFDIYASPLEELSTQVSCGFVLAVIEEDFAPTDQRIADEYKNSFARQVAHNIRKTICWQARHTFRQRLQLPDYMMRPPGLQHDMPLSAFIAAGERKSNQDRQTEIRDAVQEGFKRWYAPNLDDVIGGGYRRWTYETIKKEGSRDFELNWSRNDVSLALRGYMKIL